MEMTLSRELGERGMAQTLAAERREWIAGALRALKHFGMLEGWREFKMEDFRAWYEPQVGGPHSHHCWGALTNRARREGIVAFTGKYAASVSPKTHGHDVKVWRLA